MNKSTVQITDEYKRCLDAIEQGVPLIFVTGGGGTGKSTLIDLVKKKKKNVYAVVTPTGISALNVSGQTIHSFFGFPPKMMSNDEASNKRCPDIELFKKLDILIIDEISMVRADMLENMDICLRKWRRNNLPFGGLQVVMFGDLMQLPPVVSDADYDMYYSKYNSSWFFDAEVIRTNPMLTIELTKTFRQKDFEFSSMLNAIRMNENHRDAVAKLNRECYRDYKGEEQDLVLCSTNAIADGINEKKLAILLGESRSYQANIEGKFKENRLPAPERLTLKVGAQVMVTKNIGKAVNGTIGIVVSLQDNVIRILDKRTKKHLSITREIWEKSKYTLSDTGITQETIGEYEQFPLTLAWAITIHKSQSLTLNSVEINLGSGAFAAGMGYVAISRCTHIEGIRLTKPLRMGDVRADKEALAFYRGIKRANQGFLQAA